MRGIRILTLEGDETGLDEAHDTEHQALVRHERLVAINRYGLPRRLILFANPRPLPLVRMPIVVADQQIHLACREQCACIDLRPRIGIDSPEQRVAVDDLARARESGSVLRHIRTLLELAKHAGKFLSELSEHGIVRHHRDDRSRMKHSGRGLHRSRRYRSQRVRRASLISHDIPDDGALVLLGKDAEYFPHRPEDKLVAVGRGEAERSGLCSASRLGRPEAPVKGSQVENRYLDRRRPRVAVVVTQKKAMETSSLEDFSGSDDHAVRPHVPDRRGLSTGGGNRGSRNQRSQAERGTSGR